jgi:flagellar biosynthetic protein FliP
MRALAVVSLLIMLLGPAEAWAAAGLPAVTGTPSGGGGTTYTLSIQTLLMIAGLSFLPAALLMLTAFTRIVIVLALLRQALGTLQAPPNQVVVGLSLFLTFFVMAPVFDKIYSDAYLPYTENRMNFNEALDKGTAPLKAFMLRQTREQDLALFIKLAQQPEPAGPEAVSMRTLIPAFVISELKTAFQIGFMVFIPFLIIDLVVASVLMSMGMVMLSPVIISLPFKLMLFVLVDGWNLLIASLMQTF